MLSRNCGAPAHWPGKPSSGLDFTIADYWGRAERCPTRSFINGLGGCQNPPKVANGRLLCGGGGFMRLSLDRAFGRPYDIANLIPRKKHNT